MKKSEKIFLVEDLSARLADAKSLILADITGLKVREQEKLRRILRETGGKLMVVKNTLLSRALQMSNLKSYFLNLKSSLSGQTAIVIAQEDELAPLQVLGKFIREFERPKLKIGIVGGKIEDTTRLLALSSLPGREVLLGQLLGVLSGPMYGVVQELQGNMGKLVYILSIKSQASNSKQV